MVSGEPTVLTKVISGLGGGVYVKVFEKERHPGRFKGRGVEERKHFPAQRAQGHMGEEIQTHEDLEV